MNFENELNWIKDVCQSNEMCRSWHNYNMSMGFNAFVLMSDTYHRENFFSDVIAAILDPKRDHGEGLLFLHLFIDLLMHLAKDQGRMHIAEKLESFKRDTLCNEVEVIREKARIDIKITCRKSSTIGKNTTILIENKINNAVDMKRQIPRYIEKCTKVLGEEVICAVYLKPTEAVVPSNDGWSSNDINTVAGALVSVAGFKPGIPNLVNDWLEKCELVAKRFDVKSVIAQFSELVKHQAGDVMNIAYVNDALKALKDKKARFSGLKALVSQMPEALAEYVKEGLKTCRCEDVFPDIWVWKKTMAVMDKFCIVGDNKAEMQLAVDINCADLNDYGVRVFVRRGDYSIKIFKEQLEEAGLLSADDEYYMLKLGMNEDEVYLNPDEMIKKVVSMVEKLRDKKESMKKIIDAIK